MNSKAIQKCALGLLARREHSAQELINKLQLKAFELDDIYPVINALTEADYQSDARYAEMITRVRFEKGYGPNYIRSYLQERGVDSTIIELNLRAYEAQWFDKLRDVYRRKYHQDAISTQYAKVLRFLISRGYDLSDIRRLQRQ